jgi:hypothetical protein
VRADPGIGGIRRELRADDRDDLRDGGRRQLRGDASDVGARHGDGDRLPGAGQQLGRRDGLPRRAVEPPLALFGDDEDHAITLASSRSFRTSAAAASAADPFSISVCLVLTGW